MAPSRRIITRSYGLVPSISVALACAMILCLQIPDALAQESGLRGTVREPAPEAVDPLNKKKKRKPTRLEAAQAEAPAPIQRYEPADLDPDADNEQAADSGPVTLGPARTPARQPLSGSTTGNSTQDAPAPTEAGASAPIDTITTGTSQSEDDVPKPFSPVAADGSLERDDVVRMRKDNLKQDPIEGLDRSVDSDPYAAPGIAVGAFTLRPTVEQGLRWTNNSDSSATGGEALISETNLRLQAQSNWLRHRLNLEASGGFRKSVSGETVSEPAFGLAADLQVDVSTALQLNARASWDRSTESAFAPVLLTGPFTRPDLDTLRASLGATFDPGLIGLTATGQVTRQIYSDAEDSSGVAVPQDDRSNTFASLTLRGTYDLSPMLTPFAEVEAGRRLYDNELDASGLARSANRYGARVGVAASMGEKLSGELAVGWLTEDIDDPTLNDVSGLDLRGTMNWSPHRGTNVALSLATIVEGSTLSTSSGSVLYSANANVTHKLRENLEANLALSAGWRSYESATPRDTILSGEAGLTWWMNRYAGINGKVRHEQVLNDDSTRAYGASSVYLGITLRR